MCTIVMDALRDSNAQVEADVQRVVGMKWWKPKASEELCNRLLHTIYMGVSGYSSEKTRSRAHRLADTVAANHTGMNIDHIFQAERNLSLQYLAPTPHVRQWISSQ
ncbi:hypothetical protein BDU57DRAFT_512695 [Ampelomyces quisqualis]|uniref:Uncharacterized protein n=1 Tax=Ampelomyces quisqualis TaxID=50730 RepID=A0A6A5QW07_AMPQU|nr:hypothetical protein BDU57DRAFT_512695 [Ampelomyces quisqualis]